MSRRPTDWSPLTGPDPVPGDPDEVERAAKSLVDVAEEITRQARNLRTLSTAEGWDADAGRTFADSARDLAGQLDKAHGRYATAGGALKRYAPELRHAQSVADTALTEAKAAQTTINANQPPAYLPAGPPTPDEATAERHRQYAHDDGISTLQAARRKLDEATQHRDEHAGRAARAISDSVDHDGLADSWWDKFTNWVHEHADILKAIAEIAEMVATVLSTIALLISWIPVLDFLSPVLLGLAALASGVALVCNLMLALAGDGSWLDVAVDLFAVVTFGFGAKAGLALRAGKAITQVELEGQAASRAVELQDLLPAGSQGRVTMAVGKGIDANGTVRTVIGTSEPNGYLRPAVRAALGEEEEIASGLGHAEQSVVSYMSENGTKPITVGAGRPICPPCAQAIKNVEASPATPLKVPTTQLKVP